MFTDVFINIIVMWRLPMLSFIENVREITRINNFEADFGVVNGELTSRKKNRKLNFGAF